MSDRTCLECGLPFTPSGQEKICSKRCANRRREFHRGANCAGCGKWIFKSKTSSEHPACRECRTLFYANQHGSNTAYRHGCRCGVCLAGAAARARTYRAGLKARTGLAQKRRTSYVYRDAACADCSKPLTGASMSETPRCVNCLTAFRSRSRKAATRRKRAIEKLAKAETGRRANGRWPFVQGICAMCGEAFARRGQASRYCSRRCSKRDHATKWITRVARLAIYERDGWQCQLCMEPVDPNLHYLDDWAASLDHIVPRSHMLIPDHSPENLQLSHRWCNSVKGDGQVDEDFFRVAA